MTNRRHEQARLRLAQEAARLMVSESIGDYQWAKEKAAQRLGIRDKHCLPQNEEIDQAAAEYARLFAPQTHTLRLERLRKTGIEAMEFFHAFNPYLVGGAASGTVGEHTPVVLELYADEPEQVIRRLRDTAIPYAAQDYAVTGKGREASRTYPKITFLADGVPVELLIFPAELRQQKLGGKERLSLKQLRLTFTEEAR